MPEPQSPSFKLPFVAPSITAVAADNASEAETFSILNLSDPVVIMLLFQELVREEQVREAWERWRKSKDSQPKPLWRVLAELEGVNPEVVYATAAEVYGFRMARVQRGEVLEFLKSIKSRFSQEQWEWLARERVLPIGQDVDPKLEYPRWILATHDPTRSDLHRRLGQLGLHRFELCYAPCSVIEQLFQEAFVRSNEYLERVREEAAFDLGTSYDTETELIDEEALEAEINRSKLINLFEATLVEAVRQGASDIHIFPNHERKVEIHFRIDGELNCWHVEDKVHPEAFLAVVKDQSGGVDRFERDKAQDGFIQRRIDDHLIRFRVSVLPIATASYDIRAESIVIRVLDDRKVIKDLRLLGLSERALERFEWAIRQPYGMVIVTGPTGSGKSTTLYAALHQVVSPRKNVLTVEDPVEYIIPGVRQIKLNHKLGLEDALRAILRHDPDIVMVGEMRDRQTAELAIKLANTGHLTFSTLHTNDAPSAVSRLYKMGIEPFLIAYAINLVVAQRLIRKVCPKCRVPDPDPDPVLLMRLGFTEEEIAHTTFYKAAQNARCPVCKGVGYKGRRAITETLWFSRTIRHMIVEAQGVIDEDALRAQAIREGMQTLQEAAREVVLLGETTVEEMMATVAFQI
ncbi:GspE/PulE family protein [Rhodothermus bifroesti]